MTFDYSNKKKKKKTDLIDDKGLQKDCNHTKLYTYIYRYIILLLLLILWNG